MPPKTHIWVLGYWCCGGARCPTFLPVEAVVVVAPALVPAQVPPQGELSASRLHIAWGGLHCQQGGLAWCQSQLVT